MQAVQMNLNRGSCDPWERRWTPSKPGHSLDLAGKRCPPFHLRGANLQGNVSSSMQTRERRILLPTSGKSGQAYAVNIKTASQKVRVGSHISLSMLTSHLALTALRNQFTVKTNEGTISPQDARLVLAREWMEADPSAQELFALWEGANQVRIPPIFLPAG